MPVKVLGSLEGVKFRITRENGYYSIETEDERIALSLTENQFAALMVSGDALQQEGDYVIVPPQ